MIAGIECRVPALLRKVLLKSPHQPFQVSNNDTVSSRVYSLKRFALASPAAGEASGGARRK